MNKNIYTTFPLLISFLILIVFGSCIDIISVSLEEDNPQKVVVQASIRKGNPSIIEVYLSQSADFLKITNAIQISGARVKILDKAQKSIDVIEREPGFYQTSWTNNGDFNIERGESYQLEIEMPDGKIYHSEFEPIYAVPKVDSIHINIETRSILNEQENIVESAFIQFQVETPLKHPSEAEKAYLKWDMEGVFRINELLPPGPFPNPKSCYISEFIGVDQVNVFNGFETSRAKLDDYLIYEEPMNWHYSAGYYLTVYQQSLSKGAYEYWQLVGDVASREGSLFETPAGKIVSNIYNVNDAEEEVLGYFYVTEVDTIRRHITAEDANYPQQPCTPYTYEEAPSYCRQCLDWPKSSTIKPDYWID